MMALMALRRHGLARRSAAHPVTAMTGWPVPRLLTAMSRQADAHAQTSPQRFGARLFGGPAFGIGAPPHPRADVPPWLALRCCEHTIAKPCRRGGPENRLDPVDICEIRADTQDQTWPSISKTIMPSAPPTQCVVICPPTILCVSSHA